MHRGTAGAAAWQAAATGCWRPPPLTCARRLVPPGVQIALLGHRRHCSVGACCGAGQAEDGASGCLAGARNSRSRQFDGTRRCCEGVGARWKGSGSAKCRQQHGGGARVLPPIEATMMATMMSAVPLPIFANGVTSLHTLRSAQQESKVSWKTKEWARIPSGVAKLQARCSHKMTS